jgi:hypothetical protein
MDITDILKLADKRTCKFVTELDGDDFVKGNITFRFTGKIKLNKIRKFLNDNSFELDILKYNDLTKYL